MKYIKILGLAAVAAMALMASVGAGTASAKEGVLCSTTTNPCTSKWAVGTVLDFSAEESTPLEFTSGGLLNTCTGSTVKGKLTANPNGTGTATGENTEITWTGCTHASTTIKNAAGNFGGLTVEKAAGSSNGTVRADGEIRVTIAGLFPGENCVYGVTNGTHMGTLKEGNPATMEANTIATKITVAGDSCVFAPASALWKGKYVLTSPTGTTLSVSSS